jgi:hypothetical protein
MVEFIRRINRIKKDVFEFDSNSAIFVEVELFDDSFGALIGDRGGQSNMHSSGTEIPKVPSPILRLAESSLATFVDLTAYIFTMIFTRALLKTGSDIEHSVSTITSTQGSLQ